MAEVIVFAREPVPGRVKTRLIPVLGDSGACRFYSALVSDAISRLAGWGDHGVTLAADPNPGGPFLKELTTHHGVHAISQSGTDLGARMANAMEAILRATGEPVVLIGTDLPTLPLGHLEEALSALSGPGPAVDAVFCPSTDGGYYLVGAAPSALDDWPRLSATLFKGIPWSTPDTLHATLARARDAGLAVALGPAWYDVDEPDDLDRLCETLRANPEPPLPETRAVLAELGRL